MADIQPKKLPEQPQNRTKSKQKVEKVLGGQGNVRLDQLGAEGDEGADQQQVGGKIASAPQLLNFCHWHINSAFS
jgi:hypothetical protein